MYVPPRINGLTGAETNLKDNQHLRMRGVVFGPGGSEDRWVLNIPNGGYHEINTAVWAAFGSLVECCDLATSGLAGICDVVVYEVVTQVRQEYRMISPALSAEQFEQLLGFHKPTMPEA